MIPWCHHPSVVLEVSLKFDAGLEHDAPVTRFKMKLPVVKSVFVIDRNKKL